MKNHFGVEEMFTASESIIQDRNVDKIPSKRRNPVIVDLFRRLFNISNQRLYKQCLTNGQKKC